MDQGLPAFQIQPQLLVVQYLLRYCDSSYSVDSNHLSAFKQVDFFQFFQFFQFVKSIPSQHSVDDDCLHKTAISDGI